MPDTSLDGVFAALSDPTRRAVLARLALGQASVGSLAQDHQIALPTFMRHLSVLEASGLIETAKVGRVRTCQLRTEGLARAQDWISNQQRAWNVRLDRLEDILSQPTEADSHDD